MLSKKQSHVELVLPLSRFSDVLCILRFPWLLPIVIPSVAEAEKDQRAGY